MRGLLLSSVCAVAALPALQSSPLATFSGIWDPMATLNYITTDASLGTCNTHSSYYYKIMNTTFPTAGVRTLNAYGIDWVAVVANNSWFNVSDLCQTMNVMDLVQGWNTYPGLYPWAHWFEANTSYAIIVASSSTGSYVGEVWDGLQGQIWVSNVTNNNKTWGPLIDDGNGGCAQNTNPSLYDAQVVWINASGYYNVFVGFTQSYDINTTYPGTPPGDQLPSGQPSVTVVTGNVTGWDLSAWNCTSAASIFVAAKTGGSNSLTAQIFTVWLNANQAYSFIVSAGEIDYMGYSYQGKYSLSLTSAYRVSLISPMLTFAPPDRSTCTAGVQCLNDTSYSPALPFGEISFLVPANSPFYLYLSDKDQNGNYMYGDLEFYVYNGYNPLALTCGGVGSTCVWVQDYPDGSLFQSILPEYTVIAQAYSSSATFGTNASFDIYVVGGMTAAPSPMTTTAPSTHAPTPTMKSNNTAAPTMKSNTTNSVSDGTLLNPCLFVTLSVAFGFLWM
jgi:hypothetical protein